MLEKLFTSRTRVGILKLLLFRPDEQFHLRDIARIVDVNPTYASKELSKLSNLNIVKKSEKGNLSLYSANEDCPFLPELKGLFLKTDYLGDLLKKELSGKARFALIYGSFARGDEREGSDIDLLVISEMAEDELLKISRSLEKQTGREVNYILWNDSAFKKRQGNALLNTILDHGFIMLIGDENEFRKEAS
jgi:predicted nucleotidyltransferase